MDFRDIDAAKTNLDKLVRDAAQTKINELILKLSSVRDADIVAAAHQLEEFIDKRVVECQTCHTAFLRKGKRRFCSIRCQNKEMTRRFRLKQA